MTSAVEPRCIDRIEFAERYCQIRAFTEKLCQPLEIDDYVIQSIEDVSPPKWHLGHTTWFFEQVVLQQFVKNYRPFNEKYYYLFNSYYNSFGNRLKRPMRGTLSRPTVAKIFDYRSEIDSRLRLLITSVRDDQLSKVFALIELGLNHEQQHQELLLTDIKSNLGISVLYPAYRKLAIPDQSVAASTPRWVDFEGGTFECGRDALGFAYDNEIPRHKVYLKDYRLMDRLVTCGDFLDFIEDGGYTEPTLWLDDGWNSMNENGWEHPHFWHQNGDGWDIFTLGGLRPMISAEPVCHLSFFEAAAYARWAGKRIPTEFEWERAAQTLAKGQGEGIFVENELFHPAAAVNNTHGLKQMLGDVWEWTSSAYLPYPGYVQAEGALGEYNGKFMSGQMVCRGGSCVSSRNHVRITYRSFFQPDKRWQFLGFRLAANR